MFNPRTGRWTQPDPLFWGPRNIQGSRNVMAQAGNLYMFVMHNPVRWVDPTGLSAAIPMAMLGTGGLLGPMGPSILRPPSGIGAIGNPGLAGGFTTGMSVVGFNPVMWISTEEVLHMPTPTAPTIISREEWTEHSTPRTPWRPNPNPIEIIIHHTVRVYLA